MKWLIFIVIVGYFLTGCSKIADPEFREISAFQVKALSLNEASVSLSMKYFNPNNFTLSVKETDVKIYLNGRYMGRMIQDTTVVIGREANFILPLSGTIPLQTFLTLNLKNVHKKEVQILAEGSTKVGKAGIFISKKITYQGMHRLDKIRF